MQSWWLDAPYSQRSSTVAVVVGTAGTTTSQAPASINELPIGVHSRADVLTTITHRTHRTMCWNYCLASCNFGGPFMITHITPAYRPAFAKTARNFVPISSSTPHTLLDGRRMMMVTFYTDTLHSRQKSCGKRRTCKRSAEMCRHTMPHFPRWPINIYTYLLAAADEEKIGSHAM